MQVKRLYQTIADDLIESISQGKLVPGDKLASIRQLAAMRQVSIATIQRALEELEMRGLIEARPKSGFYVKSLAVNHSTVETPVLPMVPKAIKIHALASDIFHQCDSPNISNLGTTYPAPEYFPKKSLQQAANKVIREQMAEVIEVHFSSGQTELKNVLAQRMNQLGTRVTGEELIITNGCLEALSLCLRAVARPGDTIAMESPGFIGLFQIIESLGYKALEIPCDAHEGMSIEALELAIEQWNISAVALVPTYSNPLGSSMPETKRERIVNLLATHNIPLIEDDMLGDLSFDGARHKPCKAFDKKGLVLYCSSVSKTIASGLRIGWIAPGAFHKEVSYFKTFTNISAPNITQLTLAEFLKSGKYDRFLRQFTAILAKRMYQFKRAIERCFPKGTKMSHPSGGCILWVSLPMGYNGLAIFKSALKLGIAITPGQLSSATRKFDHCIRINCASKPSESIDELVQKLSQAVELSKPRST